MYFSLYLMSAIDLKWKLTVTVIILLRGHCLIAADPQHSWIRINQLGYAPKEVKVAVFGSKQESDPVSEFELVDAHTSKNVFKGLAGRNFGKYGPFTSTYRLDFSAYKMPGCYYVKVGNVVSPSFNISKEVYQGRADFILRYLRQQRSGYNPFLKDSCHTKDGYIVYGPVPASTHIDVSGGWHDATDYLQYVTTSANATYHLLSTYRDFSAVFKDTHLANGLEGANGVPDVLDEGKWGLQWLLKMHPHADWMFNQLADDRDHAGMRLPDKDSVDYGYGKGAGRPVYFITGKPQGLGKYSNRSTGAASTAGKFASAFALGAHIYKSRDHVFADLLAKRSLSAYAYGLAKPGVAQTAPTVSPYFYEEDNWTDDMELGAAALFEFNHQQVYLTQALAYSRHEKVTPWMGADTANHYQWYPFHNFGHYELAKNAGVRQKRILIQYYKEGIERVLKKASHNAFYRGIPFIWCSNNLTVSFTIQCYLYRQLSGDHSYEQLEKACFDWLFGCNPWGKSMVYGMPESGDTPHDPHSSFSKLYQYPIDGGMVDGPVYTSIYSHLVGIKLTGNDKYAEFQSDLAVYHDDSGDYSTNEPTMDGSASLVYLLAARENEVKTLSVKVHDKNRRHHE
jgi:endoglucanase